MIEILKASAGSGKTFRLARKYIEILMTAKDDFAYRHILAVTFTNKATDEMKGRILKELHTLSANPSASKYLKDLMKLGFSSEADVREKAKRVLNEILHDYSAFSISTIDKFFQQALKAFSREIGQFASYQVELDRNSLVAESVDRILDSLTEEDSTLLSWLTDNVLEQIEEGGRYSMDANLLEMAKRLKSQQRKDALTKAGLAGRGERTKDELLKIRSLCRKAVADFRSEVRTKAVAALDVLEQAGVDPNESRNHFMMALYDYKELSRNDVVKAPKDTFLTNSADSDKWFAQSKAKRYLPLVHPFLEAPLNDFCDLFGTPFKVYNTALILDRQLYGLGVAAELDRAFNELMKEKNVLCIDDSNTILRDIIDGSDAPFVYEKLGVRYENFLLDEFQDTADVQWSNFSPLLRESESYGGGNLIVGDVKQSIYRWRGSDWKLLNNTVPGEFPEHRMEVLDTNYRSLRNIVNFNNVFFLSAAEVLDRMSGYASDGPLAGIYSDVAQKVNESKEGEEPKPDGYVSMTFCGRDRELEEVYGAVCEAREAGAEYSEITVLVRTNKIGEKVSLFLIDKGVPVMTDDSLHVKTSVTVRRLMSLMSLLDNPKDTVNGYLAESLKIGMPSRCSSLVDMVEALLRELKRADADGVWKGEVQHIQSFMDHIQDYVAANGNNLRGFLKYWEGENPSISSPSSGNSVRVMTIHKAKGLDAPYVILPFVESITLYEPGKYWCAPELKGTSLAGVADGVYDVTLSEGSRDTLFAGDYESESFLQQVDNINTIYVAMTRARSGMHIIAKTPPKTCVEAVEKGVLPVFNNFSQILYWFASVAGTSGAPFAVRKEVVKELIDTQEVMKIRFDVGTMVDFAQVREKDKDICAAFEFKCPDELPSYSLNPESEDSGDVQTRGRLKFTADSIDFFSEDGEAGISASNRIKGVVLHDILAGVERPEDLEGAVRQALQSGLLTSEEAEEAGRLLSERLASAEKRGWFPEEYDRILNESSLIDADGGIYRPDRVVIAGGKVIIIDYKFGEHHKRYERQLGKYSEIWHRLGYSDVSAFLWYVHTDEVMEIR